MSKPNSIVGVDGLPITCLGDSHELIVSDDLNGHLLACPGGVPGSDHIAEHTLARVSINIIAFVQGLPDIHPLIIRIPKNCTDEKALQHLPNK